MKRRGYIIECTSHSAYVSVRERRCAETNGDADVCKRAKGGVCVYVNGEEGRDERERDGGREKARRAKPVIYCLADHKRLRALVIYDAITRSP